MKTEEKKKAEKTVDVFCAIRKAVPDGADLMTTIGAAKLMIADCLVQSKLDDENISEYLERTIIGDIKGAIDAIREEKEKKSES